MVIPSSQFFDFVLPPIGSEQRALETSQNRFTSWDLTAARSAALTNTPKLHANPYRRRWAAPDGSELTPGQQLQGWYTRKGWTPRPAGFLHAERCRAEVLPIAEVVKVSCELRFSSVRLRAESRASRMRRQYMAASSCIAPLGDAAIKKRQVRSFSDRSRLRLQSISAELDAIGEQSDIMVTLTYPGRWSDVCSSGRQAKQHLRSYRERLTRYLKLHGLKFSALWFLEFQLRGAPHFHLILFGPGLQRLDIEDFDHWSRRAWSEVVSHSNKVERAKHLRRGSHANWMVKRHFGYAAKYASKAKQKAVPEGFRDVGRFWGLWNYKLPPPYCVVLEVPMKQVRSLAMVLARAIKHKSIPYANILLARFEVETPQEFRNLSASAVVFGTKAFEGMCTWIDGCRGDKNSYVLSG